MSISRDMDRGKRKKALIPIDFSPGSDEIVRRGLELCDGVGSISLLYVMPLGLKELEEFTDRDSIEEAKGVAEAKMEEFVKGLEPELKDLDVSYAIAEGDPASTIIELGDSGKFDAIIMGHRGYSYIEDFFIGSVALKVISKAKVPVVIVKKEVKGRDG